MEVKFREFLTSVVLEACSHSRSGSFTLTKRAPATCALDMRLGGTHSRSGGDGRLLPEIELQPPGKDIHYTSLKKVSGNIFGPKKV
jgi:hypothetical protein